jgi:hypothetical protein
MRFAYGLILIALLTLPAASALAQNLVDGETLHALEAAQKAVHAERILKPTASTLPRAT